MEDLTKAGLSPAEWQQWKNEPATQALIAFCKKQIETTDEALTKVVAQMDTMERTYALANRLVGEKATFTSILDSIEEAMQEKGK